MKAPLLKVLVSGAADGLGRAVAETFAKRHGNRVLVGLLDAGDREKPLRETAHNVLSLGGNVVLLPRREDDLRGTVSRFLRSAGGGVDVVINNFHKGDPASDLETHQENTRDTMACMDECRTALGNEERGSIVTISPPVRMGRLEWFSENGVDFTVSKYSMTMATLAEASGRIRANCLWARREVNDLNVGILADAVYDLAVRDVSRNAECVFDDEMTKERPDKKKGVHEKLNAFSQERVWIS